MAKNKKPKKRNPQDATLRNINALKKRVASIERLLQWSFDERGEFIVAVGDKHYRVTKKKIK